VSEPTLRVHPWHRPPPTPDERALEIEQLEKEVRRQTRTLYLRYGLEYALWFSAGLFLLGWSMHTTDTRYAGLAFWGGLLLGDGGMLWSLVRAQHEAEKLGLH
jgi:hypothetical protein